MVQGAARIDRFDTAHHPKFRSLATNPGRLKFSHRRHMAQGLNLGPEDRFPARTWNDLAPEDRQRYRAAEFVGDAGSAASDLVQLDCRHCHQLAPSDSAGSAAANGQSASGPAGASGDYYLPIRYEEHCRACHQLPFDPAAEKPGPTIPHGLQPNSIRDYLDMHYAQAFLQSRPELFERAMPERPLPNEPDPEADTIRDRLAEQRQQAALLLRGALRRMPHGSRLAVG